MATSFSLYKGVCYLQLAQANVRSVKIMEMEKESVSSAILDMRLMWMRPMIPSLAPNVWASDIHRHCKSMFENSNIRVPIIF
jgi:hypothetical protein